jgi:methyl-accepting chemotaxis protein
MRSVLLTCALIFIAGILLTGGVFYLIIHRPIGPTYGEAFNMLNRLQEEILYKSVVIYACTVFAILAGIVAMTLLYSHRVAGPVFRLSQFVRGIRGGKAANPVSIRQKDVIHPLAHEVNAMGDWYRQQVVGIKQELARIEKCTERIREEEEVADEALKIIGDSAGKIFGITSKLKL